MESYEFWDVDVKEKRNFDCLFSCVDTVLFSV